ncbi:murein L,D-transpeptidase, partial [Thioalkalivibrio sp.]|uniref:L,D-transpeptidase family protein n=1 Tax=Thioalkalivibrio sp. TaxID=2093813 RepID=UPI003975B0E2
HDEAVALHIEAALDLALEKQATAVGGPVPVHGSALDAQVWFYAARGYMPAWNRHGRLERLVSVLEGLVHDGLNPDLYHVAELRSRTGSLGQGPAESACTDLLATRAYLSALLHLALGRLDPMQVEPIWRAGDGPSLDARRLEVIGLAEGMLDDIEGAMERARPDLWQYRALRRAHVELDARDRSARWLRIPAGPLLRPAMIDSRVPLLRARLAGAPTSEGVRRFGDAVYDEDLVEAVRAFQRSHHLHADGIVGPETLSALNVPPEDRLEQIRINLERLRWLAREMEDSLVLVDIAGAQIHYFRRGEMIWSARTQVGRPSRPTPRLRSEITHMTFNPSWTVPPTILREDKLPLIREDADYLERNGLRVLDSAGNRLDPEGVDWGHPGGIVLRQEPGPENALGRVAFRFPNPFHVYLHDTPSQGRFASDRRAVSSGCVRVERPLELVDLLIEDGSDAGPDHAERLVAGGQTRNFHLTRPIPILLAYWTADVDAQGNVRFRPDIYHSDQRLAKALAEQAMTARAASTPCNQHLSLFP